MPVAHRSRAAAGLGLCSSCTALHREITRWSKLVVGNAGRKATTAEEDKMATIEPPESRERLFETLYQQLHRAAQRELRRNAAVTLSPTTLLHETYLSMSSGDGTPIGGRAQFMTYAARAMRGLLIDYVRNRQAQKRGGLFEI